MREVVRVSKHVFFGKFCIEQVDNTDEYRVSAMPMSDKERDALAGIVRCRDCKRVTIDQGDHDYREPLWCGLFRTDVSLDGYCAWGKRREESE